MPRAVGGRCHVGGAGLARWQQRAQWGQCVPPGVRVLPVVVQEQEAVLVAVAIVAGSPDPTATMHCSVE